MTRPVGGAVLEPIHSTAPSRSRRSGRRARRRARRRFWFVAIPISALIVAATVVAGDLWRDRQVSAPAAPSPTTAPIAVAMPGQTVAFARLAADGTTPLIGVAVVGGVGPHGAVILLDPATVIEVPTWGEIAAQDLVGRGGTGLLATGVEVAFGIRIDEVALLDDVAFDEAITASSADGGPRFDEAALLEPRTATAAMDAWLVRLRDESRGRDVTDAVPTLSVLVVAAQHEAITTMIPIDEWGHIDPEAAAAATADLPDDTRLGVDGRRAAVELLDGRGDEVMLNDAAACLIHSGASIAAVADVPAYSFERTAIVFHDPARRDVAETLALGLGTGEVALRSDGANQFDVTVFIGADFGGCVR